MINLKYILIGIICTSSIIFAEVPEADSPAVQPNYSIMMPTEDEADSTKSVVGDDDLNQDKIDYGIGYEENVGTSSLEPQKDDAGRVYYLDSETGEKKYEFIENERSEEYKNTLEGIDADNPDAEAIKAAKAARDAELEKNDYTPKRFENMYLHDLDASGKGASIVGETFLNAENLESDVEYHKKASEYYKNNFGYSQSNNTVNTFVSDENAAKLAEAYELTEELKADLTAKYSNKSIQCYITRQLIPKYYCPLVGKQNTLYAGDEKTASGSGMAACGENCTDEKTCVSYNVLDTDDLILETETLQVHPNWSDDSNKILTEKINSMMMVDNISFEIEVTPSSSWTGSQEEFEQFLEDKKLKVRYSIIKLENSLENPNKLIVDKEILYLKSSYQKKTVSISNTAEYFNLIFYKPFFYDNKMLSDLYAKDFWENVGTISIKNLKGKYTSKDLYFCPFRQIVNSDAECDKKEGETITLNSGSQVYNICTDNEHKIGPDKVYGGFYTESSCTNNCVESKDCEPTYSHYTNYEENALYKATVGCVDDETNTACTQAKCEALLAENDLTPLNEWVTYNDDTKKQTVTNTVIDINSIRPKFNLGDELNISTSYSELFQTEMKDAAYKYMIDNSTFNRVVERIGEEPEKRMSYEEDFVNSKQRLFLNLKPSSFDIDNEEDYNLYIVMEMDQLYRPVAGVFLIDGNQIQADREETNELQFLDKTYMIRTSSASDMWKVFKKIEFTNRKKLWSVKRCENGDYEWNDYGYYDNQEVPSSCTVFTKITYPGTPHLNIDRNVFYQPNSDTFATYDANNEKAEVYLQQKFSSDVLKNNYQISSFLQAEIENAPGGIIRNQESLNHDLNFRKIYSGEYLSDVTIRGWAYNYKFYAFYSKDDLTYKEIIDEHLVDKNVFYDKINRQQYPSKIEDDGEINNNIEPFLLGAPDISTINIGIDPYLQEEGQRVFKFLFLYDDEDGTNPFDGYEIQGN